MIYAKLYKFLPIIISPHQSGFVRGRNIADNFLLAKELLMDLDRLVRGHNVILKLDMAKAYDRVEWDFIFKVLTKFGFCHRFISLIAQLLYNCWFSISFHGTITGYFNSTRGVRQGDPIAPALFILAEEVLSRGLLLLFQSKACEYFHVSRGTTPISHLLYADDTMIFSNGRLSSIKKLLSFLSNFEKSSGQCINASKSCFISSSLEVL